MYRCSVVLMCAAVIVGGCRNPTMVEAAARASASDLVYEITDLGTLGGRSGEAVQINALGHVAGRSQNAAGENRGFFWDGSVMRDIGPAACCFMLLNDQDQVAWNSVASDGSLRAMFWDNGTLHDLGTLGGKFSWVSGINNLGQVVGKSGVDSTSTWEGHAFLWHNGVMTDLGTLGGSFSEAVSINDRGQVVGTSRLDSSSTRQHAFLWQGGTMTDLGGLGGNSQAVAINNVGWIVGTSAPGSDFAPRYGVLWRDGEIVNLGTRPGDLYASVTAVNDRGEITGVSCVNLGCDERYPYVWKAGRLTTLDPEYHFPYWQRASTLNNDGLVVGYRETVSPRGSRAVVWDAKSGAGQNLGTLDGPWASGSDINEAGTVVGWASLASGEQHATVWRRVSSTPVAATAQ
jgi:probable HAF family extracellular repeat protein